MNSIRVACVGDSLTFGYLVENRIKNCYPTRLNSLLGTDYQVQNFGVNGLTLLKSGDGPYWNHKNFKLSSEFKPHLVLIMLGTNDSKPENWTTIAQYTQDYNALIEHYQSLISKPQVYLMTPPTAFILKGEDKIAFNVNNNRIREMTTVIKKLGSLNDLTVIDINQITANRAECFPLDGVHTNASGANLIATTAYQIITSIKN